MKFGKFLIGLAVALLLLAAVVIAVGAEPYETGTKKVQLCHAKPPATAANGWNKITVSIKSVKQAQNVKGHDKHKADIIPPFKYGKYQYPGKNWDAEGKAIYRNGCKLPPPPVCEDEAAWNYGEPLPCVYDVCPNLEGLQETVPDGYIKPGRRCIPKPIKPVDFCDNLEGFQAEVPEGMIWDEETNTCNPPPPPCDPLFRMWLLWDENGRECYIISSDHPSVERQATLCFPCSGIPFTSVKSWSGMVDSCDNWELDKYRGFERLYGEDLLNVWKKHLGEAPRCNVECQ